jgi:hypothetical protein
MIRESNFMGRSGFYWFHGVVEDRQDPDKLGRVKVRILGSHTKDKTYIKSEDLLWSYTIQPITSAAMNGIGTTPLGPVPGTWVFGFFRDGDAMQEPCIVGSIGGIPQTGPDSSQGFNDPRDSETPEKLADAPRKIASRSYPFDGTGAILTNGTQGPQYPQTDFLLEPDTNRIARNEKIDQTVLQIMSDIIDNNVPIAFTGTWSEPSIWYNGVYPYVHVTESESGHVSVIDDTPDAEGQLEFDRTGTFREILTDGSQVTKIVGDGYMIVLRGNHIHVMNDHNQRSEKEHNLSVGGRWNVEVSGNINILGHKGLYLNVLGDANVKASGDVNIEAKTDVNIKSAAATNITAGSKLSIIGGSDIHITAAGTFAVDASLIHLNSGVASPSSAESAVEPKQ